MEDSKKFPEKSEGSDVESKHVENRDLESRDVESRDVEDYSDLEDGLEQLKKEESQSSANDIELKDYKEVEPLQEDEVRWFYESKDNKGRVTKLKPMVGYDSLRVERAYRDLLQNVHAPTERLLIRGGLFEVNVRGMVCYPVSWLATSSAYPKESSVVRGTWFDGGWMPISEKQSRVIEKEHRARWKGCNINLIKEEGKRRVMHSVKLDGCHVEWMSVTNVLLYGDAAYSIAIRTVGRKFGVSKETAGGSKIHRGYKTKADMSEDYPPITQVVLVIHGIGARADRNKIVRNTNKLRRLSQKHRSEASGGRILFLPIEWRSSLKLNEKLVESITLPEVAFLRKWANSTGLDILYYTSPRYCNQLVNSLKEKLNNVYNLFKLDNPSFNGKVHVIAHSLGNIILHDVLTNWKFENNGCSSCGEYQKESLAFKVDTWFSMGSPLAIFLAIRGHVADGSVGKILPSNCKRIYNIYHPTDPVVYRLEPLVYEHYSQVAPVKIEPVKSKKKQQTLSPGTSSPQEQEQKETQVGKMTYSSMTYKMTYKLGNKLFGGKPHTSSQELNEDSSHDCHLVLDQDGWRREDDLTEGEMKLDRRLDFVLQKSTMDQLTGTGFIMSHVTYWDSPDVAKFIRSKLEDCEGGSGRKEKVREKVKKWFSRRKKPSQCPKVSGGVEEQTNFLTARRRSLPDLRVESVDWRKLKLSKSNSDICIHSG